MDQEHMSLQEAFDRGFDAVKGYVDRSFDSFEDRILEMERSESYRTHFAASNCRSFAKR